MNLSSNLSNYFGAFLLWIIDIHKENYDLMWLPLIIQNTYLLLAMIGVMCVTFPDPSDLMEKAPENIELVTERAFPDIVE